MENEVRYYLREMLSILLDKNSTFKPSHLVVATKLPTGAIEIQINTSEIKEKIKYMLDAYDADMHLKTNSEVVIKNIMIV